MKPSPTCSWATVTRSPRVRWRRETPTNTTSTRRKRDRRLRQFALAVHFLGGARVSGVAGYLADNVPAAELAGAILLDGVRTGDQLSGALVKLEGLRGRRPVGHSGGAKIGAPLNIWNSPRTPNVTGTVRCTSGQVRRGRPGRGVHADRCRAAIPSSSSRSYVAAGFPQKQNRPAVQELSVTWLNQWFTGRTGIGDDLVPGSTITIDTPEGPASAVVIGNPPAVTSRSAGWSGWPDRATCRR